MSPDNNQRRTKMRVERKSFIKSFPAEDVTRYNYKEIKDLIRGKHKEIIYVSTGIHGLSGIVFTLDGEFYKITNRSGALFQVV